MECWATPDDGFLVKLDGVDSCSSEGGEEFWVLLDPWHDVVEIWRDDSFDQGDSECRTTYEVEGLTFLGVVEERFADGRTNFSREVEFDDLEELDPEAFPDEVVVRAALAEWTSLDRVD